VKRRFATPPAGHIVDELDAYLELIEREADRRPAELALATEIRRLRAQVELDLMTGWSDFLEASRRAIMHTPMAPDEVRASDGGRGWSIEMGGIAEGIAARLQLVGPCDWKRVPIDVLLDGWWALIHERAGLEPPLFDRERVQKIRDDRP
jgi:hypothetical protein